MSKTIIFFYGLILLTTNLLSIAQSNEPLLTNVDNRKALLLDGSWSFIVDPYKVGYKDSKRYNFHEYVNPRENFAEYEFLETNTLEVPGDWNSQKNELFFYEGTVWYQRKFTKEKIANHHYSLYFGAVNYKADVFLNGKKIGSHEGGFTPFNFDITDYLISGENYLVVAVNNERKESHVPTLKTDWWNYGGITRSVKLIELPSVHVRNFKLQLDKDNNKTLYGWLQLNLPLVKDVEISIPELNVVQQIKTNNKGIADIKINANPVLWSPQNPKLYEIQIAVDENILKDHIGFRTIETTEDEILLNGKPIFLKGISIHEETPDHGGRVVSKEQGRQLLLWAKELNCNYVRLAHYPHNEDMVRLADEMGLLVWSEIPVYWDIEFDNDTTYLLAERMLTEMINRDQNRASVVIWSMANETPQTKSRTIFLNKLIKKTREMDKDRLISAALHRVGYDAETNTKIIEDELADFVDILSVNNYCGWYGSTRDTACYDLKWARAFNKPMIMSEFGGGAKQGYHASKDHRWSEEFQAEIYRQHIIMFENIPFLAGISPWILKDFRSPARMLPGVQDYWNRKGLISEKGIRKEAFFVLQDYYNSYNK
ncbi:glycoside hydrolase family 2 protein [Marinigracilibium pacificum]|uniref:Beta-glucuronidase n=1 Tax=Marinigracilibium pacificum TaxID=2729599 RepID=A0A848IZM4_9BACT|nr:glycoside hydrolase family 2 TIM barrel-domain containing protein [Marinigracilibium pacificum]NMM48735.1 beta-glucuronidase [Marinigracilibium pacificum]